MAGKLYTKPTDAIRNLKEVLTSVDYAWEVYYLGYEPSGVYTPFITLEQNGGVGYNADTSPIGNFSNIIFINLYCTISDGVPILDYVDQIYDILSKMHDKGLNPPSSVSYNYNNNTVKNIDYWQFTLEFTG